MFSCEKPPNCLPKWLPFCILTNNERVQVAPHPHPHLMFSVRQIWGLSNGCVVDQFSSVQSLSRVRFFMTPWTAARQASLSITNSQSLPKLMPIESVMPSNHLILCCPLLLLPSIPPQHQGLFQWVSCSHQVAKGLELQLQHQSFQWTLRTDLLEDGLVGSPCSPRDSQESSPTPQFKSINSSALSFLYSPALTSTHDYWKTPQ